MNLTGRGLNFARRGGAALWQSPTLMTWTSLAIRMGGLVLLLPLVLTHLGEAEVLVWQMLATIVALLSWFDFGFSPTVARVIAFARGGGTIRQLDATMPVETRRHAVLDGADKPIELAAVLDTLRAIYRRIAVTAVALGGALGTAALVRPIEALASPSSGWAAWAFTAAAGIFALLNVANVAVITGFDRIAEMRRIEALVGAAQLLSTSLTVVLGGGLLAIVACYSAWTILLFLLNAHLAAASHPASSIGEAKLDPAIFRLIWPAAWRSGVGILMSAGIIQGSGLVYAQFATVAEAASYLLALRLMSALSLLAQAPFYTKLPKLAKLKAENDGEALLSLARHGVVLSHWAFVAGGVGLLAAGPFLLDLIGSSVHLPGELILATLVLAFFVERYCGMHMQLYTLSNHVVWHIANGVTGSLIIVLSLLLAPSLGAGAVPVGMLVGYVGFFAWYAPPRAMASLGESRWRFDKATAFLPAAILLIGVAALLAL